MTATRSIALILTTRDRRWELLRLFDSLAGQTNADFVVRLGDQNPPGYLDDILALYTDRLRIERVTLEPMGLSRARNILLPQVQEDIVVLPDDDCWYLPDTLERVADTFSRRSDIDVLLGQWTNKKPVVAASPEKTRPVNSPYSLFFSASSITLFFRAAVFQSLLFDENFGIGCPTRFQSGEETDLLLRARDAGFSIAGAPSIAVRHDNPPLDAPWMPKKARSYARGRMALLRKHKMPLWFRLANIVYPLAALPLDCVRECRRAALYRWAMFGGRVNGALQCSAGVPDRLEDAADAGRVK
ncbi:MAG: glycosyltransferase [Desulfovibrio sp.]|nr:glycosyltransferase [Desulfovibrio sp.]